jgi:hypothetical protein
VIKDILALNLIRPGYDFIRAIIDLFFCPKGMPFFLGRFGQGKIKVGLTLDCLFCTKDHSLTTTGGRKKWPTV